MKSNSHRKPNGKNKLGVTRIIDADGHVRETDEQINRKTAAALRAGLTASGLLQ